MKITQTTACLLVAATCGSAVAQDAIDDVIARYQFDNDLTNSSTALSLLGQASPDGVFKQGNDIATATAGPATFVEGWKGDASGAIEFDGVDDWVDIGTNGMPNAFNPGGLGVVAGTLSAWVQTTQTASGHILGVRNDGGNQAMLFGIRGNGALYVFPRADNSSVSRFIVSEPSPTNDWQDGDWHHVAVQWDGSAEQGSGFPMLASVYVDGERRGADSTNFFLDPSDAQVGWNLPVALGGRSAPGGTAGIIDQLFAGVVDDLRIFGRALTDQEVADMVGDYDGTLDGISASDIDLLRGNQGAVAAGLKRFDLDEDGVIDASDAAIWVNYLARTDFGDVDLDGDVDSADEAVVQSNQGLSNAGWADGDVTGDGLVNLDDLAFFTSALVGDYNSDGFVSQGDLDLVLLNWGDTIVPAGFDEGNLDGGGPFDGLVSQNELDGVLLNWGDGTPPPANAIPEPTSLALLSLGGLMMARRRKA